MRRAAMPESPDNFVLPVTPVRPLKVLLVADGFPINGGSRIEKFVKFLPEFGVEPIVLSAAELYSPQAVELQRNSLSCPLKDLPRGIHRQDFLYEALHVSRSCGETLPTAWPAVFSRTLHSCPRRHGQMDTLAGSGWLKRSLGGRVSRWY